MYQIRFHYLSSKIQCYQPRHMIVEAMDQVETNLVTLSRHVLHEQSQHSGASGDLTLLLVSIQLGCKFVSSQVRRAGLANL